MLKGKKGKKHRRHHREVCQVSVYVKIQYFSECVYLKSQSHQRCVYWQIGWNGLREEMTDGVYLCFLGMYDWLVFSTWIDLLSSFNIAFS